MRFIASTDLRMSQNPSTPPRRPARRSLSSLEALAARATEGDERAFEELHRRLGGGLRSFLHRRLGGHADLIAELSQATWVEVWRAIRGRRYDPQRARITTFVYAVGNKMLLRHFRVAGREGRLFSSAVLQAGTASAAADSPEDLLHDCELLDALRDCLQRTDTPLSLTAEERTVVTAAAQDESERSLARRLGIAASTINARKKTAYAKLRRCLTRKGFGQDVAEHGARLGE
jgi:RNA polymerase sigma factor (sigma-70 family)